MAAIAIARAGASVTILEAASQLGEIGAGIQMVCRDDKKNMRIFADAGTDAQCSAATD